jgi:amino acid transporter
MNKLTRSRKKALGLGELIAIALGGMVGGGIFSILGIAVEQIGNATPIAIMVGGLLAFFAAYSYVKLALYYKDEGATYSFFKRTFPHLPATSSIIGWLVVFGYISTLALYAFTFSSYLCSEFEILNNDIGQRSVAGGIILVFALINSVSVKGMGKVEDILVYTKLIILLFISGLLAGKGDINNFLPIIDQDLELSSVLIVASLTFVAYEGFQLVIHAYNEMENPKRNIPRAIYSSILIAALLYAIIAFATLSVIPKEEIIRDKEYALAAGAKEILGGFGQFVVIFGALLATSSAISGTLFGASRLMAVISNDGFLPKKLSVRVKGSIPRNAIIVMSILSFVLILSGGLQLILEFGSITFILVSLLMAYANYRKRTATNSHAIMALIAMIGLFVAGLFIFIFEYQNDKFQLFVILGIFVLLAVGAILYPKISSSTTPPRSRHK